MPLVSAIYLAVFALYIVGLGYWVTLVRGAEQVSLGTGESPKMERAVRIHGNTVENVPLALMLLLAAELQGASATWIHALGSGLMLARLLHAYGLLQTSGRSFGRFWGTALTWTVVSVLAVLDLVLALGWGALG